MIICTLPDGQLLLEVLERVKAMRSIELLVVLAVTALNLSVMSWCVRPDQLVPNTQPCQLSFKGGKRVSAPGQQPLCKLRTIIRLYTFNGKRKALYHVLEKQLGRICAVFLKGFQIAKTAVLVDEGILIPLCSWFLTHNAHFRNIFHINLHSLPWILHLLVGFGNIFWIWQLGSKLVSFAQKAIQAGNGSGVPPLAQFHSEHNQTSVLIAPEHVQDEFDLFRCVLVRVAARPM